MSIGGIAKSIHHPSPETHGLRLGNSNLVQLADLGLPCVDAWPRPRYRHPLPALPLLLVLQQLPVTEVPQFQFPSTRSAFELSMVYAVMALGGWQWAVIN